MKSGETEAHRDLKRLALEWARAAGLPLAGCEVRVPKSPYRADVAAISRHPMKSDAVVALFECKQCRADFLRDHTDEPGARATASAIAERLRSLRSLLASHRPDLRRGESLFADFDSYDLDGLRHDTLHGLERKLEVLQRKLISNVKFSRLHKYHTADLLYLVTEPGIIELHEIPVGWGWLLRDGDGLILAQPPVRHATSAAARLAWLENIALAGTSASSLKIGVLPAAVGAECSAGCK